MISSETVTIMGDMSVAAIEGVVSEEIWERISLVTTAGPHALSWITESLMICGAKVVMYLAKSRGIPRFSISYVVAMLLFKSSILKILGSNLISRKFLQCHGNIKT